MHFYLQAVMALNRANGDILAPLPLATHYMVADRLRGPLADAAVMTAVQVGASIVLFSMASCC